jgi:hypothetical protein
VEKYSLQGKDSGQAGLEEDKRANASVHHE